MIGNVDSNDQESNDYHDLLRHDDVNDNYDDNENYSDDDHTMSNTHGSKGPSKERRVVLSCLLITLVAIASIVLISLLFQGQSEQQEKQQEPEATNTCCACHNPTENTLESCFCAYDSDDGQSGSIDFILDDDGDNVNSTMVEFSISYKLCTLVQITPDGKGFKPVARSYNSHPWAVSAGAFASVVAFDCTGTTDLLSSGKCKTVLPPLPAGAVYQLRSFPLLYKSPADTIARFLEQTTFGVTRSDIAWFQGDDSVLNMAQWIREQQNVVQTTSHRQLYRQRLNGRREVATVQGKVTHPCEEGARYRRYAFSDQDFGKNLTIDVQADNRTVISVDGFVRTVTSGPVTNDTDASAVITSGTYKFYCYYWSSTVGGTIRIELSPDVIVPVAFNNIYGNPTIQFEPGVVDPSILLNIPAESAIPIDLQYFEGEYQVLTQPMPEIILTAKLSDSICASIGPTGNPIQPAFAIFDGVYWMHDPRFETLENTLESPAMDGGGAVVRETLNILKPEQAAVCANAPRTFINEEHCVLSHVSTACSVGATPFSDDVLQILLSSSNVRALYEATGNGTEGSRFVYAITGLRPSDDYNVVSPCEKRSLSRWVAVTCSGASDALDAVVASMFTRLLSESGDTNPTLRDIYNYHDEDCPTPVFGLKGFEVKDANGKCWLNVHTDHMNVYDFTGWTLRHPGNSLSRNPIKEFAHAGLPTLAFPSNHTMDHWISNKDSLSFVGRIDDWIQFVELPSELRTPDTAAFFGLTPDDVSINDTRGTLVCGSPFEVWNEPYLGGSQGRGAFDSVADLGSSRSLNGPVYGQKKIVWTEVALSAPDQLRQRVAWALSQILVVSPSALGYGHIVTEELLVYYDIFVRHAFGNYRDILKEVSYSPVMAEMLTYYGSQSTAYVWMIFQSVSFADENYAREIMQLFTTGLARLNPNGTQIIDEHGEPVHVYSNDDIEEYARVWTGFISQPWRGNIESIHENRIDPMVIDVRYRDPLPKMGLERKYIGDGYPLCADLPQKHFLKQGSVYRLLGSSPSPQLQLADPPEWKTDMNVKRLVLEPYGSTSLFTKLCGSLNPARCNFEAKIILDEDLDCSGNECSVDTVRVVEVTDGIYYEYVRPPCIYKAFFDEGKTVVRRGITWDLTCADPLTEMASAACCTANSSEWKDEYWGERLTFRSAQKRCGDQDLCNRTARPSCDANDPAVGNYCFNYAHSWTTEPCAVRAMIDTDGNVAIVHSPFATYAAEVNAFVRDDSKTFFRVDWSGDIHRLLDQCNATGSCNATIDGLCVCDIIASDEQVHSVGAMPTRDQILTSLFIGAFAPSYLGVTQPTGSYDGVDWYSMDDSENITAKSIFVVEDDAGVRRAIKNMYSKVSIMGHDLSFRNPVHFISLTEAEPRDANQETDAALDHYFYHPNTAPFLAIRFAQRFGISNPSPTFIEAVSAAFRTGSYSFTSDSTTVEYGSGNYGDLASTIASLLLHPESRSVHLDMDPSYGSLKEPLMKVVGLMRSLELTLFKNVPFTEFNSDVGSRIGQMAHEIPNVFSFFLPEYRPSGVIGTASLVSPEAQLLIGPRVIETLNGLLSLIRYGLTSCFGGLGATGSTDCTAYDVINNDYGCHGVLRFVPSNAESVDSIISELSTLLTAGRLSNQSRDIINQVVREESNLTEAMMKAQQLMVLTPEFHSTSISNQTGMKRSQPDPLATNVKPYKALVYVLLAGGVDSYNVLVPHTCTKTNDNGMTLLEQYNSERSTLAFTDGERFRIIDAGGQPCSQFAIHQDLEIVERLYKESDLAFFANTGVLNAPTDKYNYTHTTRTYLFAHNTMQDEAERVDPFRVVPRTGILGRLCDVLARAGHSAQPISVEVSTVATVGTPAAGRDRVFASRAGPSSFYPSPEGETFDPRDPLEQLNGETSFHSGLFGETWSASLHKAIHDSESLMEAVSDVEIMTDFQSDDFSQLLKAVATLVASHDQRGTDRDVFYVRFDGFDHHGDLKINLSDRLKEVNDALAAFSDEMKSQQVWDNVTVLVTSDFGRTLTANSGRGSDHGWGGHYFMMGGSVKGGQIHGEYPDDITGSSPLNIGRGRLIPTLSWESILSPIFNWMGVTLDKDMSDCLPNRQNTGATLLPREDLFL